MANDWITALKAWNTKKGGSWCVPRKGTKEYDEVKAMMGGNETPEAKKEREGRNKAVMETAVSKLRQVEAETKARNVKRVEEAKKSKVSEIRKVFERKPKPSISMSLPVEERRKNVLLRRQMKKEQKKE
jgi:hypothetical protein